MKSEQTFYPSMHLSTDPYERVSFLVGGQVTGGVWKWVGNGGVVQKEWHRCNDDLSGDCLALAWNPDGYMFDIFLPCRQSYKPRVKK